MHNEHKNEKGGRAPLSGRIAYAVRMVSVPPVMAAALIAVLALARDDLFTDRWEIAFSLLFLSLLPAAAYPLSWLLPWLRRKGREGQRNAAFALSVLGYTAGWAYATWVSGNDKLILIYAIYLFSVALLLLSNKVFGLRASGHASSIAGPMIVITFFFGAAGFAACLPIYCLVLWSSVATKRHTAGEFLMGSACSLIASVAACFCYGKVLV